MKVEKLISGLVSYQMDSDDLATLLRRKSDATGRKGLVSVRRTTDKQGTASNKVSRKRG